MTDWRFPADVRGWLTEEEGRALARLAEGKSVLEIGSFCGRSTICMAQTARFVLAVDPFDGRGTPETGNTHDEFQANLSRYGLLHNGKVRIGIGTTSDLKAHPEMRLSDENQFDLIFIDGAHDYQSVRADIEVARKLLSPAGVIAFHDYRLHPGEHDGRWDPGVTRAVQDLLALDGALVERAGSIAVVRLLRPGETNPVQDQVSADVLKPRPHVFLGMPSADRRVHLYAALAFAQTAAKRCQVFLSESKSSLFPDPFNALWANALNLRKKYGFTHFGMLHTDVAPAPLWVDTLVAELERTGADLIGAVIPIKDQRGLSSTAVDERPTNPWAPIRRLTMHEAHQLPETFGNVDVGAQVLVNTGCWVCRLDRPWCDAVDEDGAYKVFFEVRTRIIHQPDGTAKNQAIPEDWNFSRKVAAEGGVILATRKVLPSHFGDVAYPSDRPWGTEQTDRQNRAAPYQNGHASAGTSSICLGVG